MFEVYRVELRCVCRLPAASTEEHSPRPRSVKYRIGQVVRHKVLGYRGVIVGWDAVAKVIMTTAKMTLFYVADYVLFALLEFLCLNTNITVIVKQHELLLII